MLKYSLMALKIGVHLPFDQKSYVKSVAFDKKYLAGPYCAMLYLVYWVHQMETIGKILEEAGIE